MIFLGYTACPEFAGFCLEAKAHPLSSVFDGFLHGTSKPCTPILQSCGLLNQASAQCPPRVPSYVLLLLQGRELLLTASDRIGVYRWVECTTMCIQFLMACALRNSHNLGLCTVVSSPVL
jgi:hypothetical protein